MTFSKYYPNIRLFFTLNPVIFALLGAILFSLGNISSKYISVNFEIRKSLVFQYLIISCFGAIFLQLFSKFSFTINNINIIILLFAGFFGYLGIWSLFKSMSKISNSITLVIAYTYVFFSYFLNVFLVGESEKFSLFKIFLGILYFLVISVLLFERDNEKKLRFNKFMSFAFITSFSWTIYFSLSNFLIKTNVFLPSQMLFYVEFTIFIFAIIFFLFGILISKKSIKKELKISLKQLKSYVLVSFFLFSGGLSYFIGYKYLNGNLVNFISLSTVIFVPILSYFFFKERLKAIQIITIFLAFVTLLAFVWI